MIASGIILCFLACVIDKLTPIYWSPSWVFVPGALGILLVVHGIISTALRGM